jgi:hemerythrin
MADATDQRTIEWSEEFRIGIDELDFEHCHLIEDINRLHAELLEEVDMGRLAETLGSIHSRIQAHFALEERVMQANRYPHYADHKAEHERLLDEYTERIGNFQRDRNLDDRMAIESVLRRWIVDHILTSDRKMSLMVRGGSPR